MARFSLFFLYSLAGALQEGGRPVVEAPSATSTACEPTEVRVERGVGLPPLYIPIGEKLTFRASVRLVPRAPIGTLTLESGKSPHQASLLELRPVESSGKETVWMRMEVHGEYSWNSVDATIESRVLPQEWPALSYRYLLSGSKSRRREVLIGHCGGRSIASYRRDTAEGAPRGTRIWSAAQQREVPEGSVDMLTAMYLVRTMIREKLAVLRFPLLDQTDLWQMTMRRGSEETLKVEAGTYDVVEILLEPAPFEGEHISDDKRQRFTGLVGLDSPARLLVERSSGIPIRISGEMSAGIFSMEVVLDLGSYSGTLPGFRGKGS